VASDHLLITRLTRVYRPSWSIPTPPLPSTQPHSLAVVIPVQQTRCLCAESVGSRFVKLLRVVFTCVDEDLGPTPTRCEQLRDARWSYPGAYRPQCTESGDFAPMQCHAGTGECWCVQRDGQEIPGTIRRTPNRPVCSGYGKH